MSLFQNSVLASYKQDEALIASRWAAYQNFLAKTKAIREFKEEEYQEGFLKDVFESCLGYTLKTTDPANFTLERETKNETDSKKADGAIYVGGKVTGVIELKAQNTQNLDKATDQAFGYLTKNSHAKYVIVSNFDELRFYVEKATDYEKFHLFSLDYEGFKKMHLILSYESIAKELPHAMKQKSQNFEQEISKQLYKDFSAFRTHLFENIVKNNFTCHTHAALDAQSSPNLDKPTLLRLTQKLCDRIIFILFAEDRGLLNPNTIKEIRSRHADDIMGNPIYGYYKIYFDAINKGNEKLAIPKYNGGLFAPDALLESLVIDDEVLDMEAQKLSDYDFASDISVNILGHIFEQSLTDLEELQAQIENTDFDKKQGKRKKDGVFYTPEYITRYIVQNTLGRLCEEKKAALSLLIEAPAIANPKKLTKEQEKHKQNILDYRAWLENLKILDPACGSGAFLNQALEFLIREHTAVRDRLLPFQDLTLNYEIETAILEHNLYGVDINEDAVEIARLSLWLRTAQRGRTLTDLSGKIKCGNSLIDDKTVADNAFVWEEEFPEVFAQGGFDVVIGNPPYVGEKGNKEIFRLIKKIWKSRYEKNSDLLYFFFMKSIDILKENANFGFITTNYFLTADSAIMLRKELKERTAIYNLINFNETKVFESALGQHNIITIFKKTTEILNTDIINVISSENISSDELFTNNNKVEVFSKKSNELFEGSERYIRVSNEANKFESVFTKMLSHSKIIDEICFVNTGFNTGADRVTNSNLKQAYKTIPNDIKLNDGIFILSEEEFKEIKPEADLIYKCYKSSDIDKYISSSWQKLYVIWTKKDTDIDKHPNIKTHLEKYRKFLELKREYHTGQLPWFSQHWAREYDVFGNTDKIVLPYRSKSNIFSYSNGDYFGSKDILYLRKKDNNFSIKYLLALLNSNIYYIWLYYKGKRKGETLELYVTPISQIPIKDISSKEQQPFVNLVDEILETKPKIKEYKSLLDDAIKNDNFDREIKLKKEIETMENRVIECEKAIDAMVYKLYNLTDEEIKIVENSNER